NQPAARLWPCHAARNCGSPMCATREGWRGGRAVWPTNSPTNMRSRASGRSHSTRYTRRGKARCPPCSPEPFPQPNAPRTAWFAGRFVSEAGGSGGGRQVDVHGGDAPAVFLVLERDLAVQLDLDAPGLARDLEGNGCFGAV